MRKIATDVNADRILATAVHEQYDGSRDVFLMDRHGHCESIGRVMPTVTNVPVRVNRIERLKEEYVRDNS